MKRQNGTEKETRLGLSPFAAGSGNLNEDDSVAQTSAMDRSPYEVAWAAGFFDGEGSASCAAYGQPRKDGTRHYRIVLSVSQCGAGPAPAELVRFQKVVGVGSIYGPLHRHANWKPMWQWQATSRDDIENTIDQLWPWLCSTKREQIEAACRAYYEALDRRFQRKLFRRAAS